MGKSVGNGFSPALLCTFSAGFHGLLCPSAACPLTPAKVMSCIRCGLIKAEAVPSPRGSYILKGVSGRNKVLRQKQKAPVRVELMGSFFR